MRVHAGHGLDYGNVARIAALSDVEEAIAELPGVAEVAAYAVKSEIAGGEDEVMLAVVPEAGATLTGIMEELGKYRVENPIDDITSALVNAEIEDEKLTQQELASLKACRQLLPDGLFDHPRSGKADQGARLGDIQITQHGETCRDAARSRIGQHADEGAAARLEARDGGEGVRHLARLAGGEGANVLQLGRQAGQLALDAGDGLGLEAVEVVGDVAEHLDMPAVRLETLRYVFAEGERSVAVDGDVVVVVDAHETT